MKHEQTDVDVARIYLPTAARDTPKGLSPETVGECLKRRAAEQYNGFTAYDASGGWVSDEGQLITEDVEVIEIIAPKDSNVRLKHWVNVNLRTVISETDESMAMALVNGEKITVE